MPFQTIPRDKIYIRPDRQRQEFTPEALSDLTEGLKQKGLFHAPVLRPPHPEEMADCPEGHLVLVAGERRLLAIENLWLIGEDLRYNNERVPEGFIPYCNIGDLTPLEAEEAEYDENFRRSDLTWQERSAAAAKLDSLRKRQAAAEGRVHTLSDTAMELKGRKDGSYQEAVRQEVIVSRYLDNPEVQKASSVKEAYKLIKRAEETQKNVALAASVGATFTSAAHTALNVNCLDWMRESEPEVFDCILTDPPYGMGADTFGDGGGKLINSEHHYDDSFESWQKLMGEWCALAYRIAKPQAHAYVFCDQANFQVLTFLMKEAGWYVFRTMLIAHKPNSGRLPLPDLGPRRQYETILYAIKGNKKVKLVGASDVISTVQDANLSHGAQKPTQLYMELLKRSCSPGDSVLDSFSGSGTIFPSCHRLKLKATGLEQNPEYYAIGFKRLQAVEKEGEPLDSESLTSELFGMLGKK
jgi:site-specific DNA-methyltransferase (adenine-specific)